MHRNTVPILPGFWSDPTICRGPEGYVLAHSSFEYFPGAPVHVSQDLLAWRHVGNVITRPAQTDLTSGGASTGVYGSTLRHHDGRYWFITTNINEVREGQLLFTAGRPEGPWSDPVRIPVIGIDPDIAWDDDGTCLVTWCGFPAGIKQVAIDPATGALLEEPRVLWSGTGMRNPEGPHLYRIGDWWYLLIAEGGTDRGHCVSVARGRSARGPFEGCPDNPILTHRSTDHPVQGVGHADLVEGPDGAWFAVHHGIRPAGGFPEFHVLGRETFLAPVDFRDGWPVFELPDADLAPRANGFVDDFTGGLHPRWVSPSGDGRGIVSGCGGLQLAPGSRPLLTRVLDKAWRATAEVEGDACLQVRIDDAHFYGVETRGELVVAVAQIGVLRQVLGTLPVPGSDTVELRIEVAVPPATLGWPASEPDLVALLVRDGEAWRELARLDGR